MIFFLRATVSTRSRQIQRWSKHFKVDRGGTSSRFSVRILMHERHIADFGQARDLAVSKRDQQERDEDPQEEDDAVRQDCHEAAGLFRQHFHVVAVV